MFSPIIVAVVSLSVWYVAEKHMVSMPKDLPRDVVTYGHVDRTWHELALSSAMQAAIIAVLVLVLDLLSPEGRNTSSAQWMLFGLGLCFSLQSVKIATNAAYTFAEARKAGRAGHIVEGDYWPSWVFLPLFPLLLGIGY